MPKHIYSDAKYYSENNALQYNFAMQMLSNISFRKESRVLDIGCGDGLITSEIARIVTDGCVIGTDISQQMVDHASAKYQSITNIRFLQMDAGRNIFRDQFDIITSFNCLHWVSEQEEAIKGIARAAIGGAQVAILLSHRKSLYHNVLDTLCASSEWKPYFEYYVSPRQFYSTESYKKILEQYGLNIISAKEEEMIYHFESRYSVSDFLKAAGSHPKLVPPLKREKFLSDFSDLFIQNSKIRQDGAIPVAFWCLQIVASKPIAPIPESTNVSASPVFFAKL